MFLQFSAELYYNGLVGLPSRRIGILPGAFNPPTEAHLALARAALTVVEKVLFVLPRTLPHKEYSGVPFAERFELLKDAIAVESRFSAVQTQHGLFIDIARELKANLPAGAELHFLCGRDAAERIANWDYGSPHAFDRMLEEFSLLVAPREGHYEIAAHHRHRISSLDLEPQFQIMSATAVRDRILKGMDWEHLVPVHIRDRVRLLYSPGDGPNTL